MSTSVFRDQGGPYPVTVRGTGKAMPFQCMDVGAHHYLLTGVSGDPLRVKVSLLPTFYSLQKVSNFCYTRNNVRRSSVQ